MKRLLSALLALALAIGLSTAGSPPAVARPIHGQPPATQLGPTHFLFGAYTQKVSKHAAWAVRGINTLVTAYASFPGSGYTAAQYNASATNLKLWQIRSPEPTNLAVTAAADAADQSILSWNLTDEPDGAGAKSPAQLATEAAALRVYSTTKAVKVNFTSANIAIMRANDAQTNTYPYLDYFAVSGVDWTSGDTYPETTHNQDANGLFLLSGWNMTTQYQPYLTTQIGAATANLYVGPYRATAVASAGKTTFQYMTTSRADLNNPNPQVPTASVFRLLSWSSIINGSSGIFLFPQVMSSLPVTADINGTTLNVTATNWYLGSATATLYPGTTPTNLSKLYAGLNISASGVTAATITGQLSSTETGGVLGGRGTYSISGNSQGVISSRAFTMTDPELANGDGSDPLVLAELKALIDNVNTMQYLGGNLLMDQRVGGRKAFTIYHSRDYPSGDPNAQQVTMPAASTNPTAYACNATMLPLGFEGATFVSGGTTYYLVLNMIGAARTLTCATGPWSGVSGLVFSKYEVKLFTSLGAPVNLLRKAGVDD